MPDVIDPLAPLYNPARRRAILFADLVESVRLYERFEARTIDRWRRFVAAVRESVPAAHGGRLVRTVGDGLLMEFDTAAGASGAAAALHQLLESGNEGAAPEMAMRLRIGLHIAAVVSEDEELYGSGVNLAARLATLGQPGQTVASADLRHELADDLHARIEDLGLRWVKHLDEPVRAFVLHPVSAGPQDLQPPPSADDLRPAVAVVPFTCLPADPANDALGFAVADDVIASLSRHPGLRVLSRVTTAAVRHGDFHLEQLRRALGASFLLTGRFIVRGDKLRLNAELCELRGGQVLWAGSCNGSVDALFDGQDDMVPHLVAQVSQHVMAHELSRVRSLPLNALAPYSLYLGASALINSLQTSDFDRARDVIEHLIDQHPRQAALRALLSHWHVCRLLQGWAEDPDGQARHAAHEARAALDIDPALPAALVADGVARIVTDRDFAGAQEQYLKALVHDPHNPVAWARLSETQSQAGDNDAALASVAKAIALSPLDPQRYMYESFAARAALVVGRYDDAARHARASLRRHALHAPAHRGLIGALWLGGRHDEARAAAADYLRALPGATVSGGTSAVGKGVLTSSFARALLAAGVPP